MNEGDIASLVRQVVTRTLGQGSSGKRPVVDAVWVQQWPAGTRQRLPAGALVTPLARQVALERRITLTTEAEAAAGSPAPVTVAAGKNAGKPVVAIGSDHGGFPLKEPLIQAIMEAGYQVTDCGTHSPASVDYPDYAYAVARLVANGQAWRGIVIDGAGIGSCMAANKVPGVRAAMCYDQATAVNSREHNDANVLTLGAGLIGPNLARQITLTWLATDFGGGRHARRVDKIKAIEKRFTA